MAKEKRQLNLRLALLAGTAILLLIIQIAALFPGITTPLELIEYSARDMFMRLRGVEKPSDDIVIVAIDDFSFNWTGYQWPWPRSYFAEIVDQINAGGAKVIGVDVFLFEPDENAGNDQAFAEALGKSPSAVNVMQILRRRDQEFTTFTLLQPLSPYRDVLDGVGITSFIRDEDAIVRNVQAFDSYNNEFFYHWAFDVARLYLGVEPPSNLTTNSIQFNGRTVPLNAGQLLVNFSGPAGTYTTYSASSVALGDILQQNPDAFLNKIVLIGATTVTLQDIYPTPFSTQRPTSGVEIVASAIDTLINGRYIAISPPWMALLVTLGAAVLAFRISRSKRPSLTIIWMLAAMVGYSAIAFLLFAGQRYVLPIVIPQVMLFLGVVLPTLEQAVSQELEKRRVRNLFSRFISPEMVDQMMIPRI
jgi:adenylate cyclase